jgi:transposase
LDKETITGCIIKESYWLSYNLRTWIVWKRFSRYIDNGQVEIENNLIGNSIRPVALGRKNYMFAGSHEEAQQAAIIYSFLGNCIINDVEPLGWLKDVL